nr:MAG TPA: hypothetical protein [Caudoviricetes sp.]
MITKEELAKLSRDEVKKLFYEKRNTCRTCAQFGEMIFNDKEYIMIKERLSEFFIEDRIKMNKEKKAQAVKEFAEALKKKGRNFYPSIDHYCCSEKTVSVKEIDRLLIAYEFPECQDCPAWSGSDCTRHPYNEGCLKEINKENNDNDL